jgi:hypothetical protein
MSAGTERQRQRHTWCVRGVRITQIISTLAIAGACKGGDAAGRTSLSDAVPAQSNGAQTVASTAPSANAVQPTLSPAALAALDAGNVAYRAKQLDVALAKYREAASAAPTHAAPWFGIYMAANEMKNTALADSALQHVKSLSADPAALDAHATVTSPTNGLTKGTMPPGHVTTSPALPPGHPVPGSKAK